MTIFPRVCAEFHDRSGQTLFTIRPQHLLSLVDGVPEAVQQDPLFTMMIREGSLEVVNSARQKKELEADPVGNTTAEGRKPRAKAPDAKAENAKPEETKAGK